MNPHATSSGSAPAEVRPLQLSQGLQRAAWLVILAGAAVLAAGLYWQPQRAWPNMLLNSFLTLSASLGAVFLVAVHHLSRASWLVVLRRVPEAMMAFMPWAAALMLSIFLGRDTLYEWSHPEVMSQDPILAAKSGYLESRFVLARMLVILAAWCYLANRLRKTSLQQDLKKPSENSPRILVRLSAVFVTVFALTFTLASVDWLMSLDPHWFSTMFAIYTFAGLFLQGIAMVAAGVVLLLRLGYLQGQVRTDHLHDLGKLLLGFSTFWAYIWVSQYLLIWYANLPEEVPHYLTRTARWDWGVLFLINPLLNWAIPFVLLLSRRAKRSARMLLCASAVILLGRWLDLYLLIMPEVLDSPVVGVFEIVLPPAYLSLFLWVTARALSRAPLVPAGDPFLQKSLNHRQ